MSRKATRRAERAASLRRRILAAATTAIVGLGLAVGGVTPAMAGASDSAVPYEVSTTGITLPEGDTFDDNGHVNIKTSKGDRGIHFEAQNWPDDDPKKLYIGKSFIPWSAFNLPESFCVTWVQIDKYSEHFGEGGQSPVCVGVAEPECVTVVWSMPKWIGDRSPSFDPYQTFVASYQTECYDLSVYVPEECGTQYQIDSYRDNATTASLIEGGKLYGPNDPDESFPPNAGWDKTYKLVKNDDCEPNTRPSIDVAAAFAPMTCEDPTGSFRAGTFDPSDVNADKLLWTTTQGTVPSASNNTVTEPGTVTVTVRLKDEYVGGGYAVSDASTLGTVSVVTVGGVETSLITYTFEFTEPTGCDTVIPVVDPFSYVDNCLLGGSYTLEYVEGITYYVTVNGGTPFVVNFDGAPTKTYSANEGDEVSVAPVANDGFVLHPDQPKPFERTFSTYGEGDCQLPEFPNWPASATATDEVCTPFGVTDGSITVQFSVGPEDNPNPVRYYLAYGTPQQRELTSVETSVPAGTYVVTAAVDPESTDSINNAGQTAVFEVTVGAADESDCDLPTLALTGASNTLAGLGVGAFVIVLAGMGIVLRRRLTA